MYRSFVLAGALGLGLAASAASAADPDKAIEYRQKIFETLGANLSAVAMNLKGEVAFADAVPVLARTVADTAPLMLPAMEQNTAGEGSRETDALDKIWDNWDDFASKAQAFEEAAMGLEEVAGSGDMQAIGGQVQKVAETCKSWHDEYRD